MAHPGEEKAGCQSPGNGKNRLWVPRRENLPPHYYQRPPQPQRDAAPKSQKESKSMTTKPEPLHSKA